MFSHPAAVLHDSRNYYIFPLQAFTFFVALASIVFHYSEVKPLTILMQRLLKLGVATTVSRPQPAGSRMAVVSAIEVGGPKRVCMFIYLTQHIIAS